MKNIAFDARLVDHPGIGRYIRSLLGAILRSKPPYTFTLVGPASRLESFRKDSRVSVRPCEVPIYSLKEQLWMWRYFEDADLVHVPHFNVPFVNHRNLVVTIHDLIYFHVQDYQPFMGARFFLRMLFRRIARKAKRIIAVSESTLEECRTRFPAMRQKLEVIYEAADPFFFEEAGTAPDIRTRFGLARPYILSVGSIREHKNIQGLLQAFDSMKKDKRLEADLVLCGRLDERFNRKYSFRQKLSVSGGIHYLGEVDEPTLKSLYGNAACFVMPSFYEGFGLPVLEAMACRTPVIASSAASLPELVGHAGLTFDPHQIDRLSQLLYNVLSDRTLRQDLVSRGYEQTRRFSWQRTAEETLRVYDEVLSPS